MLQSIQEFDLPNIEEIVDRFCSSSDTKLKMSWSIEFFDRLSHS